MNETERREHTLLGVAGVLVDSIGDVSTGALVVSAGAVVSVGTSLVSVGSSLLLLLLVVTAGASDVAAVVAASLVLSDTTDGSDATVEVKAGEEEGAASTGVASSPQPSAALLTLLP